MSKRRDPSTSVNRSPRLGSTEYVDITEVSVKFGLTLRALRLYETLGLIAPIRLLGRRHYGPNNLRDLEFILKAKKAGFSLREIRECMRSGQSLAEWYGSTRILERLTMLQGQLNDIDLALAELRQALPVNMVSNSGDCESLTAAKRSALIDESAGNMSRNMAKDGCS